MDKANLKYILRLALTLFLITAVVAGLLGAVNAITEGPIAELKAQKTRQALQSVVAQGVTIGEEITDFEDPSGMVTALYATSDGYVAQVTVAGFGGDVEMVVGVSSQGVVTGVSIVSHSETSGLGAVAAASSQAGQDFRGQYAGMSGELAVTKDGGTVESISGATITSRAVTKGVNAALACAANLG